MEYKKNLKKFSVICATALMLLSVGSFSGFSSNILGDNNPTTVQVSAKRRCHHHRRHHARLHHARHHKSYRKHRSHRRHSRRHARRHYAKHHHARRHHARHRR